jgi:hypothetical protein
MVIGRPHELNEPQALRDLTHLKFIFMAVPESPATDIRSALGVMAFPMPLEAAEFIHDLGFQLFNIERGILPVNTGRALFGHDLKATYRSISHGIFPSRVPAGSE